MFFNLLLTEEAKAERATLRERRDDIKATVNQTNNTQQFAFEETFASDLKQLETTIRQMQKETRMIPAAARSTSGRRCRDVRACRATAARTNPTPTPTPIIIGFQLHETFFFFGGRMARATPDKRETRRGHKRKKTRPRTGETDPQERPTRRTGLRSRTPRQ